MRRKLLLSLLITLVISTTVLATPATDSASQLIGLGMSPDLAKKIVAIVNTLATPITNNVYITGRNAANSADINILKVDGTDDTVLNADSGDVIKLAVNGTAEATLENDQLTFSGASFQIVPGATALLFRNAADDATNITVSDARLVTTRAGFAATAGNLTFSAATGGITYTPGTLAAAGSVQGDAAAITDRVTTVTASDATKGVILPATPGVGDVYHIINTVAAVLKIYPGSGDAINASSANAAVSVAASVPTMCIATSTSQWWCSEGTAP